MSERYAGWDLGEMKAHGALYDPEQAAISAKRNRDDTTEHSSFTAIDKRPRRFLTQPSLPPNGDSTEAHQYTASSSRPHSLLRNPVAAEYVGLSQRTGELSRLKPDVSSQLSCSLNSQYPAPVPSSTKATRMKSSLDGSGGLVTKKPSRKVRANSKNAVSTGMCVVTKAGMESKKQDTPLDSTEQIKEPPSTSCAVQERTVISFSLSKITLNKLNPFWYQDKVPAGNDTVGQSAQPTDNISNLTPDKVFDTIGTDGEVPDSFCSNTSFSFGQHLLPSSGPVLGVTGAPSEITRSKKPGPAHDTENVEGLRPELVIGNTPQASIESTEGEEDDRATPTFEFPSRRPSADRPGWRQRLARTCIPHGDLVDTNLADDDLHGIFLAPDTSQQTISEEPRTVPSASIPISYFAIAPSSSPTRPVSRHGKATSDHESSYILTPCPSGPIHDQSSSPPPVQNTIRSETRELGDGNLMLLADEDDDFLELIAKLEQEPLSKQYFANSDNTRPTTHILEQSDQSIQLAPLSPAPLRETDGNETRQAFARPLFPPSVRDRSPLVGVSASQVLRTCFRIGEALNTGCQAVRENRIAIIELYARVQSSHREPNGIKQHFFFSDLFHNRPPYIAGIYELWNGSELWTFDSGRFLEDASGKRICRALGKMKRENDNWQFVVLNIWEATWEDVEYTQRILSGKDNIHLCSVVS